MSAKKSSRVTLTVVAAVGMAARGQQPADPCEASTFNEHACQEAVRQRGYCWNGRWISLRYSYPYPYYYDQYQVYAMLVGPSNPAAVGTCRPPHIWIAHGGHGPSAARCGFGSTGAGHAGS
jgi:hypothetical protein